MGIILKIFVLIIISTQISCKSDFIFDSFTPISHYEMLGNININKWGSGFMDMDSNIIFPLIKDTFQVHFNIDKNNKNALVFSIDKIDTVGFIKTNKKIVYFHPKSSSEEYILFDFNATKEDKYEIKKCGPLINNTLRIIDIEHHQNELIQTISVEDGAVLNCDLSPPLEETTIKTFKVSSKYGITEMEIFVKWANQDVKIKNAP